MLGPLPDGALQDHLPTDPPRDCPICPRLASFRAANRAAHPDWFNAPVPGWGDPDAWLAIAGLAPGLRGANRTGRPFTGDFAGVLLYETLQGFGLARGKYDERADDTLQLTGAFISNSVRCVPPQNKPLTSEIGNCRPFLQAQLASLQNLRVIIALGAIAHASVVRATGGKPSRMPFGHAAVHRLDRGLYLVDSYHCSRLNTNTGTLTPAMFAEVFRLALELRDKEPPEP
jgi:uracil-DNA glycosylase family 4